MPQHDQQIGNYTLLEKLGAGGIGEVWKARDRRLNRVVALKFILKERDGSSTTRDLLREARAASALNHPNIITVFEVGDSQDSTFLAMEYVQGETLKTRMSRGPFAIEEARDIARQVADGLAAAHREGILHRDLKPENIMIRADGIVKIVDFGLAKTMPWAQPDAAENDIGATLSAGTQTGQLLGTYTYMSPEQARGQEVTPASDVFSLGIILYELFCGAHPFRQATVLDTLNAIITKEPPPCATATETVSRALRKNAAERFASAGELSAALKLTGTMATGSDPPATRKARWPIAAVLAGVLAIALLAAGAVWYLRPSPNTSGPPIRSIAVISLRAPNDDARASPVLEGLPEELSSALAQNGFQVASMSAVKRVSEDDPKSAGAQLGVDAVLAGNVRSYGSKYKVYAELINTRTGFQVWSETFTADAEDAVAGPKKTAGEIVAHLVAAVKR